MDAPRRSQIQLEGQQRRRLSRLDGGTEALNDIARLYTDLGDGMSADSKGELWRRFVHAVSYEEVATVLGCLDG